MSGSDDDAGGGDADSDADGCGPGESICEGVCAPLDRDESNCGTCGVECDAGYHCESGACVPGEDNGDCDGACGEGVECCDDRCVDLRTDEANCGGCGEACAAARSCCSSVCVDTATDPDNCGSCRSACAPGPNADATCAAGRCQIRCRAGFVDLDGAAGCECQVRAETCNGLDDDCDRDVDEGEPCSGDEECNDGRCELVCNPPHSEPLGGECVPSCGAAGGNHCAAGLCAAGEDPIAGDCCPADGELLDSYDCRPGDDAGGNYCCAI